MPRDIFGDVSKPRVEIGSRSRYTLPVSIAIHALLVAIVVVTPLMAPSFLPTPPSVFIFAAPAPAPPPPPPPPGAPVEPARTANVAENPAAAPTVAPSALPDERSAPASPSGVGVGGGVEGGVDLPGMPVADVVAIPDPPPPPAPIEPIRPGGNVREPVKVRHVPPIYPRIAQDTGVGGVVILEAVIDVDGSVRDVRVLRSVALLDQAAIDAVRKWRFTPTLLNGVPVPIVMTVTVNFTLKER